MTDILSQDEIDCLLDVVEDGEMVGVENIGIKVLLGTSSSELQEVVSGAKGTIVVTSQRFGNEETAIDMTVIAINKKTQIAILIDSHFNPRKVNIAELSDGFYKSRDRIGAIETKVIFDRMSKLLNEKAGLGLNDLLIAVKASKDAYPEIWL